MFDRERIERAGFEEALRQIPAGVIIVEAPSGDIISVDRQAEEIFERYLGTPVPSELEGLRELYESGTYETFYPNGRPYEMDHWPLIRSIREGQEVRDEEIVHLPAEGNQFTLRCDSSPI